MKRAWIFALALGCGASSAMAQFGITFVSHEGMDVPTCGVNFATPCASLAAAYANTVTGGLIKVIDPNAYAPSGLVIDRAITIDGSGQAVLENIFDPGTPVLQIKANCTLRGLVLQVTSGDGVQVEGSGLQVHLEDVTIQGIQGAFGNGILINSPNSDFTAKNVTINGATNGFNIESPTTFSGDHLLISDYVGIGIVTQGGAATIRDSVFHGSGATSRSIGIYTTGTGGVVKGASMIERTEVSFNGTGVEADGADGPGTVRISDSVIANNGTGLFPNNGGQIISFRTNMLANNAVDGTPSLSTSLK